MKWGKKSNEFVILCKINFSKNIKFERKYNQIQSNFK